MLQQRGAECTADSRKRVIDYYPTRWAPTNRERDGVPLRKVSPTTNSDYKLPQNLRKSQPTRYQFLINYNHILMKQSNKTPRSSVPTGTFGASSPMFELPKG